MYCDTNQPNNRASMMGMTISPSLYRKYCLRLVYLSLAVMLPYIFAGLALAQTDSDRMAKPLIVDTDMGTDDWLALTYIAQNKNIELLGVTIVGNGLGSCESAPDNARHILSMSQRNAHAPIGCGSEWPLDGYASYPTIWRQTGSDMMGEAPTNDNNHKSYPDGPTLLSQLLENAPAPVEVLAIGSMTNIATVITVRPELKQKIRRIISMGGAVDVPGNLRVPGFTDEHTNTRAEWNFYIDPLAGKTVLESGISITLVPLDATNKVPLTEQFIEQAQQTGSSDSSAFVGRIFRKIKESISNGDYYHWDPLAATIAVRPDLCEHVSQTRLTVVTDSGNDDGPDQGLATDRFPLTNGQGNLRRLLDENAAGATVRSGQGGVVDICLDVDPKAFEQEFLKVLGSN